MTKGANDAYSQRQSLESCMRKRRFATPEYAAMVRDQMQERSTTPGEVFRMYSCGFCRGYHVGRIKQAEESEATP